MKKKKRKNPKTNKQTSTNNQKCKETHASKCLKLVASLVSPKITAS